MTTRRNFLIAIAVVGVGAVSWMTEPAVGGVYVVKRSDNICGLRDASKLSHPARVDHDRLVAATPEWKRIARERIDPDSALGSVLRSQANSRILKACIKVQQRDSFCSIWKAIRRRDGKPVADATESVLGLLDSFIEPPSGLVG